MNDDNFCPECERPNQFGELCPGCYRYLQAVGSTDETDEEAGV